MLIASYFQFISNSILEILNPAAFGAQFELKNLNLHINIIRQPRFSFDIDCFLFNYVIYYMFIY